MSSNQGHFVWYELNASNVEGAIAFYTETIGWKTQVKEGGGSPYTMFAVGDKPVGGVMLLPEQAKEMGAPPHWLAYVAVDDLKATTTQVTELGGKVYVPPTDIPDMGAFAVVADPFGAVIGLYTSSSGASEPAAEITDGQISWHEVMTGDVDKAWSFYEAIFGWEKTEAMDMGPELGTYQMYGTGGKTLGGMMKTPPDSPAPPSWLVYVRVDDIHAAIERAKGKGGQVLNGPMEIPGGDLVAQLLDAQGAAFALHGPNNK